MKDFLWKTIASVAQVEGNLIREALRPKVDPVGRPKCKDFFGIAIVSEAQAGL